MSKEKETNTEQAASSAVETVVIPKQDQGLLFEKDLEELINRYSQENESDTPDFILARYMKNCLDAFNTATNRREEWYGRKTKEPETGV